MNCWFLGKEMLVESLHQLDVHVTSKDSNILFHALGLSDKEKGFDVLEFIRLFQVRGLCFRFRFSSLTVHSSPVVNT